MTPARWRGIPIVVAMLAALAGAPIVLVAWHHGPGPAVAPPSLPVLPPTPSDGPMVDSLFRAVEWSAPFRARRAPSGVAYDPTALEAAAGGVRALPPRPPLSLTGWIVGARRAAIVEGIPGHDGARILFEGDTLGGLRVRRITLDHVVISGFDTTWTLTVRSPW